MRNNSKIITLTLLIVLIGAIFVFRERFGFIFNYLLASSTISSNEEIVGDGGFGNSLTISPSGALGISFINERGELIFAHKIKNHWEREVVDSHILPGNATSVAFDKKGNPNILYISPSNLQKPVKPSETGNSFCLKLATKVNKGWEIKKVFNSAALSSNLLFDRNNICHISFWSPLKGLMYAKKINEKWNIETIDGGRVGWWNSLALDKDQHPYISYFDFGNKNLLFIFFNGEKWKKEVVDFGPDIGRWNSISLDKKDIPYISYFDQSNGLKYAKRVKGGWEIEIIDKKGSERAEIALDKSDNPIILYIQGKNLNLAKKSGYSWQTRTIASGKIGDHSLLIDKKGNIHILWQDLTSGRLKYTILK
ncbi:hypothetical protein J7J39_02635 [bacterium]|nr:hypothetical protein [bacterium]